MTQYLTKSSMTMALNCQDLTDQSTFPAATEGVLTVIKLEAADWAEHKKIAFSILGFILI